MFYISSERLTSLCIKNQWFTHGDNEQYSKLFYAAEHGAPLEEIVTIIWLCSDAEKWTRAAIRDILKPEINPDIEPKVWCVDRGNAFNGMIDSKVFADYEPAKEYYDALGADTYRKIYRTFDIWNFLERKWKEGAFTWAEPRF